MSDAPLLGDGLTSSPPTGELAKALAAFQSKNHTAEKTGFIKGWNKKDGTPGQPDRYFSTLEDILKAIKPAAEQGLAHTETWHPIGTSHAILRVTLHHVSGETVKSELPVDITKTNKSGSNEQEQGSSMTYARRYLLMGIYGIVGADPQNSDDDGDSTRNQQDQAPGAKPKPVTPKQTVRNDLAEAANNSFAAPAAKPSGVAFMNDKEKLDCLSVLKALKPENRERLKADFKQEFKIAAAAIKPEHFQLPKHGEWVKANIKKYK